MGISRLGLYGFYGFGFRIQGFRASGFTGLGLRIVSVLGHILGICFREFGGRSLVALREVFEI